MSVGLLGDELQHIAQQPGDLPSQKQRGQLRLQGGVHIGAVDAFLVWQIVVVVGLQRGQGLQVVAEHLGCDILLDGELREPRDVFEVEAMLEPLKCFLDAPALVIEIGKPRNVSMTLRHPTALI